MPQNYARAASFVFYLLVSLGHYLIFLFFIFYIYFFGGGGEGCFVLRVSFLCLFSFWFFQCFVFFFPFFYNHLVHIFHIFRVLSFEGAYLSKNNCINSPVLGCAFAFLLHFIVICCCSW